MAYIFQGCFAEGVDNCDVIVTGVFPTGRPDVVEWWLYTTSAEAYDIYFWFSKEPAKPKYAFRLLQQANAPDWERCTFDFDTKQCVSDSNAFFKGNHLILL